MVIHNQQIRQDIAQQYIKDHWWPDQTWSLFLDSPVVKLQCNPLVLRSWFLNMFLIKEEPRELGSLMAWNLDVAKTDIKGTVAPEIGPTFRNDSHGCASRDDIIIAIIPHIHHLAQQLKQNRAQTAIATTAITLSYANAMLGSSTWPLVFSPILLFFVGFLTLGNQENPRRT